MKRKKTGSPVFFFMPEIFYIQDIFRKSKKIPIGNRNFWEKAIFIGYRWKNNKGTKSVDTIRFLHHSGASPFGGWRHHLSPGFAGGTMGTGHFGQLGFMEVTAGKPYNRAKPGWHVFPLDRAVLRFYKNLRPQGATTIL